MAPKSAAVKEADKARQKAKAKVLHVTLAVLELDSSTAAAWLLCSVKQAYIALLGHRRLQRTRPSASRTRTRVPKCRSRCTWADPVARAAVAVVLMQ
jgi:hypothetical protein